MSELEGNRSFGNNSTDDAVGSENNSSLIGIVKSRVSSILPNNLSKWFSPSGKNNKESANVNGSHLDNSVNNDTTANSGAIGSSRRRRRIEMNDDDDDDEDEDDGAVVANPEALDELVGNLLSPQQNPNQIYYDEMNDEDEENDKFKLERKKTAFNLSSKSNFNVTSNNTRPPPIKRSRFAMDTSTTRDSSMLAHRPLLSSTPAVSAVTSNLRSSLIHPSTSTAAATSASELSSSKPKTSFHRHTHLNLYGHQSKKDPAYDFLMANAANDSNSGQSGAGTTYLTTAATQQTPDVMQGIGTNSNVTGPSTMSARRTLNIRKITPTTGTETGIGASYSNLRILRRPPLSIPNEQLDAATEEDDDNSAIRSSTPSLTSLLANDINQRTDNRKRMRFLNGSDDIGDCPTDIEAKNNANINNNNINLTKSYDKFTNNNNNNTNNNNNNSRAGSRTSSFGNSLNFNTNLEGRKSLFGGTQQHHHQQQQCGANSGIGHSTLSLNSFNRRRFNASIYGSTSALSDSRLLNTFSPFYKGRTTYGGASAYNKTNVTTSTSTGVTSAGTGANFVRMTPTQLRPTSSLSTLSSSSTSLYNTTMANAGLAGTSTAVTDDGGPANSAVAISSTAKRILDLLNDFSTPLGDAKKIANNIKANQILQQQQKQQRQPVLQQYSLKSQRLNESDLKAARALRLSQVRSPYTRPAVTLQSTLDSSRSTAQFNGNLALPPVRELHVPSMTQLLQLKRIQNTTEHVRKITMDQSKHESPLSAHIFKPKSSGVIDRNGTATVGDCTATTTPTTTTTTTTTTMTTKANYKTTSINDPIEQTQQRHTNKMRNKITCSARVTACKNAKIDEAPPIPVDLPNIAFPLATGINFTLPSVEIIKPPKPSYTTSPLAFGKPGTTATTPSAMRAPAFTSVMTSGDKLQFKSPSMSTFNFSEPSPTNVTNSFDAAKALSTSWETGSALRSPTQGLGPARPLKSPVPQLKTGSVLEALKLSKPLSTSVTSKIGDSTISTNASTAAAVNTNSFGAQFKKSAIEWECDICLLRNKIHLESCIACETPRSSKENIPSTSSGGGIHGDFGDQYIMSSSEWGCETCLIRNKQDVTKCVACEVPRKVTGGLNTASAANAIKPAQPVINSFGDAFKPQKDTWECDTCLINNKSDSNECVACQTKKPGAASGAAPKKSPPRFLFGVNMDRARSTSSKRAHSRSKSPQKAKKWECPACMTPNEGARNKCSCCDQPSPASLLPTSGRTSKFAFGRTAAAKFKFGFANANDEAAEKAAAAEPPLPSPAETATATPVTTSIEAVPTNTTGAIGIGTFKFGSATTTPLPAAVFHFDFVGKDVADNKIPLGGFKFGTATATTAETDDVNKKPAAAVKFNLPTTVGEPTSTNVTATTSAATDATPKLNLLGFAVGSSTMPPTTSSSVTSPSVGFTFKKTPATVSTPAPAPAGTFIFGSLATNNSNNSAMSTNSGNNTTSIASSTISSTGAVKPPITFNFVNAANNSDNSLTAVKDTTIPAAPAANLFSGITFGSGTTNNTPANKINPSTADTTMKPFNLFASAAGTTATVPAAAAAAAPTPAASSTPAAPTLPAAAAMKPLNTNIFGMFGQNTTAALTPTTTSSSLDAKPLNTPFIFGNAAAVTPATNPAQASIAPINNSSNTVSSSSTWSTNSFIFGSGGAASGVGAPTAGDSLMPKNNFSGFGAPLSSSGTGTTMLPPTVPQQNINNPAASTTSPIFGSNIVGHTNTGNVFGMNPAPSASSTNLFGQAINATNGAAVNLPTFGSASSFSAGGAAAPVPAFGAPASITGAVSPFAQTFGGFGAQQQQQQQQQQQLHQQQTKDPNVVMGNSSVAMKRNEPANVFNFGSSPSVAQQNQSTGAAFNFGANVATIKPAFNFGAANATPAFNFTGSTSNEAMPPNATFQFNAGATAPPANTNSNNIFAIAPTPGGAQSAQQARRKIRAPIRRLTPR